MALAAASLLAPPGRAAGDPPRPPVVTTQTGHFAPDTPASRFVYVPFEVPAGATGVRVSLAYTNRPATALDVLLFDTDGYRPFDDAGFRGSAGGGRQEGFEVTTAGATPSYVPGPIDPGTWWVGLSPYRVAPQGSDWTVTFTVSFADPGPPFVPDPAPASLKDRPGWYRGDTHVHSVESGDGTYEPADLVRDARAAGLDFFASTEHHTVSNHLLWGRYARPDLLVVNGEEATTRNGHFNAIGLSPGNWIDYRYTPQDGVLPEVLRQIRADGAVATANHPMQTCKGCFWEFPFGGLDGMEVWNGPWTEDDQRALEAWAGMLDNGPRLTAVGSSDVHGPGQTNVVGSAQTVVHARALGARAIAHGLAAGRAYVAGSSAVSLAMTASGGGRRAAEVGQRLRVAAGKRVRVRLRAQGAAGTTVTFTTHAGEVGRAAVAGDDDTVTTTLPAAGDHRYVWAQVRRADGTMVALTNPIWIGRPVERRPVALVGRPDGSALELALAPDGYANYSERFPGDVDVTADGGDASRGWSYIQPGPADAFAGRRDHPFTLRFDLRRRPRDDLKLVLWRLDSPSAQYGPGSLRVDLNGAEVTTFDLPPGGTDGYHWGAGSFQFAGIRPRSFEVALPRGALRRGENAVTLRRPSGSWLVYDAVGVFDERSRR